MIKEEYIERANDSVDIFTLFKDLYPNTRLIRSGSRYKCNCVFHKEQSSSLFLDPVTNTAHCFGCNVTYNRIGLVKESESLSFPQAVEYLLKTYSNIDDFSKIYTSRTEIEIENDKLRESQLIAMQLVQEFYTSQYKENNIYAKACRDYVEKRKDNPDGRWDSDKIMTLGFGYAPVSGHALVDWALKKGINLDILVDIGVATCHNDQKNKKRYRDVFCDRLTIPQRNSWGRVVAFTARCLNSNDKEAKYKNSACPEENQIYKKSNSIFGIDIARKYGKKEQVIYLMEGAPDVIALYTLDIYNCVASNGAIWSLRQLEVLRMFTKKICFIPDSDAELVEADGAMVRRGESFVFKSAALALSLGFKVSVKEIPGKDGEKNDVDSYFKTKKRWNNIPEQDFIDWYTAKVYNEDDNREGKLEAIANICNMLSHIPDTSRRISHLDDMKDAYPPKKFWDIEMKRALKDAMEATEDLPKQKKEDHGTNGYGFMCSDHCYYVMRSNGKKKYWTNFEARGLFHIMDEKEVTRIFEITNADGETRMMEVSQPNITKLERLKEELEKKGNFRYKASPEQHELFKDYLYDNMPSAIRMEHMGWHSVDDEGFLTFANGIAVKGEFLHVDDYGIVEYKNQKYFLPAYSQLYKKKRGSHKLLKRFEHILNSKLTIDTFFNQVIKVYPDHGMQELAFVMATMFLDIIREESGFFPLMFHYGVTGTGKTQLAVTATRFFQIKEEVTNLESSSLWAMNNKSTAGTNIICHMDEYRNSIGKERIDFCKGVFDNAGRIVKAENQSFRQQDDIETGHIFTGQEIPNFDPALMTRSILMEFYKNIRTVEETVEMEKLKEMRDQGVAQLTIEIVCYRKKSRNVGKTHGWIVLSR